MGLNRGILLRILVLGFLALFAFQNCSPAKLGGGEPYAGSPADIGAPSQQLPTKDPSAGSSFNNNNNATTNQSGCSDGLPVNQIKTDPAMMEFYQTRENCMDVNRTITSDSVKWIEPGVSFYYNNQVYSTK